MRWLADENFNNDILRALFRRNPTLDIALVRDVGLDCIDDAALLAWAAATSRVLLSDDFFRSGLSRSAESLIRGKSGLTEAAILVNSLRPHAGRCGRKPLCTASRLIARDTADARGSEPP